MKLPDRAYDFMKWTCLIFLPAFGTAYSSLAGIWGFPFAEQVPATVGTVELFLGALIGVSSVSYHLPPKE